MIALKTETNRGDKKSTQLKAKDENQAKSQQNKGKVEISTETDGTNNKKYTP